MWKNNNEDKFNNGADNPKRLIHVFFATQWTLSLRRLNFRAMESEYVKMGSGAIRIEVVGAATPTNCHI